MIDIHSHILPSIDDGAKTLEDSLEIIKELVSQGVTDIIATPHYVDETIYSSPLTKNLELLKELKEKIKAENIKARIYLGNELYISNRIKELLEDGEITTLANSKYLLVELPLDEEFPNYEDILMDLMNSGFKVILAHPERYRLAKDDEEFLENLHKMGVLFQCNMGSINGKYGSEAKKLVKRLAKNKMIFAFGSDIHHPNRNDFIVRARKKLAKYYDKNELNKVLVINPSKILLKK